jgi:hypothetical protein
MHVNWGRFLAELEGHVQAKPFIAAGGTIERVWEAGPSATDADLAALEGRFGVPFPPSYVSFLRACNGLKLSSHPVERFLAAREVHWFRKKNSAWIRAYTGVENSSGPEPTDDDYYEYTDALRVAFPPAHLRQTIQVSAVGDAAVYLLNPQVVWPSGEWEAWFLADWNPGVIRYRSFAELVWERYSEQVGIKPDVLGLGREDGPPTVYRDPPGKPGRRVQKPPKPPRPFERIAREVRDGDLPTLQRAMKELARLATTQAIDLLEQVSVTHPVDFVRWHAREALNKARRRAGGAGR